MVQSKPSEDEGAESADSRSHAATVPAYQWQVVLGRWSKINRSKDDRVQRLTFMFCAACCSASWSWFWLQYLADAVQKQRPFMDFATEGSLNERKLRHDGHGCKLQLIPTEGRKRSPIEGGNQGFSQRFKPGGKRQLYNVHGEMSKCLQNA